MGVFRLALAPTIDEARIVRPTGLDFGRHIGPPLRANFGLTPGLTLSKSQGAVSKPISAELTGDRCMIHSSQRS